MVFTTGRKKESEQRRIRKAEYEQRLIKAGISEFEAISSEFHRQDPSSIAGWELHRELLKREGMLTQEVTEFIENGISRVEQETKEAERTRRIKEHVIERMNLIIERINSGQPLPNPIQVNGEAIPARLALWGEKNLVKWAAIVELGHQKELIFQHDFDNARNTERYIWKLSYERLKEKNTLLKEKDISRNPESQYTTLTKKLTPISISIPKACTKNMKSKVRYLRYHPEFGLIQGSIKLTRYFERGAGGFMSGGAMISEYYAEVDVFLEGIDIRTISPVLRRHKNVWATLGDSDLLIGRNRSNNLIKKNLNPDLLFMSKLEIQKFFEGRIISGYFLNTIPVSVINKRKFYILEFNAVQLH
jgi:hypothetical protein